MAFLDNVRNNLADLIRANPKAERTFVQPPPVVNYQPVNDPGSQQPMRMNQWYRLIGSANQGVGFLFNCRCGFGNKYLYGAYDLRRELETPHPCSARCTSIVEQKNTDGEVVSYRTVVNTEKDKDGNPIPVGAYHCLRDLLPQHGEAMSEHDRNLVYALLPTWRLVNDKPAVPFTQTGDWGGPVTNRDDEFWDGKPPVGSDGRWL